MEEARKRGQILDTFKAVDFADKCEVSEESRISPGYLD